MKKICTFLFICISINSFALDPNHFTITRITAPYFIVDANSPATITKSYVGFEVKNNSNSATTYTGLKFTITSIGTSVVGQNYSIIAPVSGIVNIGTLAPGETKVCYYYVSYPAAVAPQATFNVQLSDNTASWKTQSFVIRNRSCISANAGGTATQTFTNQDLIGALIFDDVTYVVGNVQNGDESDFQVAVSTQFDPTKITLLGTTVTSSSVPGIPAGATDSLYFVTGNGSNGATITVRWTFRITGTNFTTYLLPCAGATSGSTNYKYALNTSLGSGTPVTISSSANPLTITKTSDKSLYGINSPAIFTITITNPGAYGVTIDNITDQLPTGFTFVAFDGASQVTASNSTTVPAAGVSGNINFEGGVSSGPNTSYYVAFGGSLIIKYSALSPAYTASNLVTTAKDYVAATEIGSAQNTVSVSATLPLTLLSFNAGWQNEKVKLYWKTINESNTDHFEIERSNDNGTFYKLGEILAAGFAQTERTYSFIDSFPSTGANKYRLKLVDRDNRFTYSRELLLTKKQGGLSIGQSFPVPFTHELNIQLLSDRKQEVKVQLTDMLGRTVLDHYENCIAGNNTILLSGVDKLQPGIYILKINSSTTSCQQKLVKASQ
ncbi:MAG: T9SS type A sorting domain-containing protein [Chitinophagaceae bacterium]